MYGDKVTTLTTAAHEQLENLQCRGKELPNKLGREMYI